MHVLVLTLGRVKHGGSASHQIEQIQEVARPVLCCQEAIEVGARR
jgi:hypothetical protein